MVQCQPAEAQNRKGDTEVYHQLAFAGAGQRFLGEGGIGEKVYPNGVLSGDKKPAGLTAGDGNHCFRRSLYSDRSASGIFKASIA